jgi:hypothetical protein
MPSDWSHVEAEVDHVAVADHIALALYPELTGGLETRLTAEGEQIVHAIDLGPDESMLEV